MTFLPYDKKTMAAEGWDAPDFVLVTGDVYVDHPSFGAAIIGIVQTTGSTGGFDFTNKTCLQDNVVSFII